MNRIAISIACLLAILSFGCNKKLTQFNSHPELLHDNDLNYEQLALKSKVNYVGKESLKFVANIRMKKDSAIWFSISPGLGIEAARGLLNQESITVLDKIHKEYDVRSIQQMFKGFNFDFEVGMVESIIIGNLLLPISSSDQVEKDHQYFVIIQEKGKLRLTSSIGTQSMKLEKVLVENVNTSDQLDIVYSEFNQIDESIYPTRAAIQANFTDPTNKIEKSTNITLNHSRVEIDKKKYNFSIKIPSKYVRKKF